MGSLPVAGVAQHHALGVESMNLAVLAAIANHRGIQARRPLVARGRASPTDARCIVATLVARFAHVALLHTRSTRLGFFAGTRLLVCLQSTWTP